MIDSEPWRISYFADEPINTTIFVVNFNRYYKYRQPMSQQMVVHMDRNEYYNPVLMSYHNKCVAGQWEVDIGPKSLLDAISLWYKNSLNLPLDDYLETMEIGEIAGYDENVYERS